jgi:hypothetical protein
MYKTKNFFIVFSPGQSRDDGMTRFGYQSHQLRFTTELRQFPGIRLSGFELNGSNAGHTF